LGDGFVAGEAAVAVLALVVAVGGLSSPRLLGLAVRADELDDGTGCAASEYDGHL